MNLSAADSSTTVVCTLMYTLFVCTTTSSRLSFVYPCLYFFFSLCVSIFSLHKTFAKRKTKTMCGVGFFFHKSSIHPPLLPARCRRGGSQQQPGIVIPQRVQQAVVNVAVNEMVGALGKQFKF